MCWMFGRWSCAEDVLTGPLSAAKAGPLSTGHSTLDRQAGEKIRVLEMVSTSFAALCTVYYHFSYFSVDQLSFCF